MKKINLSTIFLIISLIIIITIGCFIYKSYIDKQPANNKISNENNNDIIKYELQTREYFTDVPNGYKYFINSETELNKFYSIYSDQLSINKDYLKNNSIFIQVEQVGSGSIQMALSSVTFDNNTVNFIIDKNYPEIGTADMALWYFVAIIPNNKLNNLNLNNWSIPSEILTTIE